MRYAIEAALLYAVYGIFKILPASAASDLGGWIGRTIGPRLAASRKALRNIEFALPETTPEQRHTIVRDMWDNLGRIIAEYPHLETIGREHTEIMGAIPPFCILFGGHLGNWEVIGAAPKTQRDIDLDLIYRAPNNPWADKLLEHCRSLKGKLKTIPKSRGGTRSMVRSLQDKRSLALLIDQKYNEGIPVNFMGRPAMTATAFAELAKKYEVPLIPVRVERVEGCKFRLSILPAIDAARPLDDVMKEAHSLLESWIRERPGQWLWLHRRWESKALQAAGQSPT